MVVGLLMGARYDFGKHILRIFEEKYTPTYFPFQLLEFSCINLKPIFDACAVVLVLVLVLWYNLLIGLVAVTLVVVLVLVSWYHLLIAWVGVTLVVVLI